VPDVSTVYLIVGLPCSGKTTFAEGLARRTGALRLTPDEWNYRLFGDNTTDPEHDRLHTEVEAIMWDVTEALVARGLDIILDFGFWSAEEREQVARRVKAMGAQPSWYYLDVSSDELWRRLELRNNDPAYPVKIPASMMEEWLGVFQPPTAAEALLGPLEVFLLAT